jgi:hypothetical protein
LISPIFGKKPFLRYTLKIMAEKPPTKEFKSPLPRLTDFFEKGEKFLDENLRLKEHWGTISGYMQKGVDIFKAELPRIFAFTLGAVALPLLLPALPFVGPLFGGVFGGLGLISSAAPGFVGGVGGVLAYENKDKITKWATGLTESGQNAPAPAKK